MNNGWIKIHRRIKNNWIWENPVKLKWWLTILLEVNHSDMKVNIGNQLVTCKSGQSVKSLQTWAKLFGTGKDSARNFLRLLQSDRMIDTETTTKYTRITVCNYDSYQLCLHDTPTSTPTPNPIQTNKDKEYKKDKEEEYIPFEDFIDSFNLITGKSFKPVDKYKRSFNARMKEGFTESQILEALEKAVKDEYHVKTKLKYITPEFITRVDKLEKYMNA